MGAADQQKAKVQPYLDVLPLAGGARSENCRPRHVEAVLDQEPSTS